MRCFSCHKLSFSVICSRCHARLLTPSISKRKVGTLDVVSLFKYKNIEQFLLTKHTPAGYRIYRYFGRKFVAPFLDNFLHELQETITLIAVDEQVRSGYSHTALLSRAVRHPFARVLHAKLLARNSVNYAGKSLQFRLENPRDFDYRGSRGEQVILVDDIITTGVTLQEAQLAIMKQGSEVLFAVTLADAREY